MRNVLVTNIVSCCSSLQIPNFLMSQVRRLNENSNRRYQLYDRRFKNLLRKIHTDSREKPEKNSEVSWCHSAVLLLSLEMLHARPEGPFDL